MIVFEKKQNCTEFKIERKKELMCLSIYYCDEIVVEFTTQSYLYDNTWLYNIAKDFYSDSEDEEKNIEKLAIDYLWHVTQQYVIV